MPEKAKKRSLQEINQEYTQVLLKAGQAQYHASVLAGDLDMYNAELRDLNLEAAAAQAHEQEVAEAAKKLSAEKAKSQEVQPILETNQSSAV